MMKPSSISTKELAVAALLGALTLVGYYIQIPLGPVPVTLQTLMVELAAVLLLPKAALLAMAVHLLLQLLLNGAALFVRPSFGFIIGFMLAAYLASTYFYKAKKGALHDKKTIVLTVVIAAVIPYLIGLPYMAYILNGVNHMQMPVAKLLRVGCLLFLPGDLVKVLVASLLAIRILPIARRKLDA